MSNLPLGWERIRIGDLTTIVGGGTPDTKRPELFGEGIPWITPADLTGYKDKWIAKGARSLTPLGVSSSGARPMPPGTVLLSSRAPIGHLAIAKAELATNQGFKSFLPTPVLDPEFLYYWLTFKKHEIKGMGSGTTFSEISGKVAGTIPVLVAPRPEQSRIVEAIEEEFTRLEAAVRSLESAKRKLTAFRASVLQAAIEGRLVPTEAELSRKHKEATGQDRPFETGAELLARILRERRDRWEQEQIHNYELNLRDSLTGGKAKSKPLTYKRKPGRLLGTLAGDFGGRMVPPGFYGETVEEPDAADVAWMKHINAREDEIEAKVKASKADPKWKTKYKEPSPPDTSNLTALPEGWAWASLSQVSDIQGGIQKQPSRAPKRYRFPFLRVANVKRGALDLEEIHEVELFSEAELRKLRLAEGDLLIVEGNGSPSEIGRMAVWRGNIPDCVHQNHIIRARLAVGVTSEYVEAFWNSPTGAGAVLNQASSTTGLHTLSVSKVGGIPIPLPPLKEQERIIEVIAVYVEEMIAANQATKIHAIRAERLRQAILKAAFEGKLVPQDPTDEPASALLDRIRSSKDEKRIKPTGLARVGAAKLP